MHHLYLTVAAAALLAAAPFAAVAVEAGPFDHPSPLPLQAPQFGKIQDADFQPALEAGMAEQRAEAEKIANNPAPPTFENTFVAMERSGRLLDRVTSVFFALTSANTNPTLEKVEAE
jgi:peptidyl-dipeptidase Dcp